MLVIVYILNGKQIGSYVEFSCQESFFLIIILLYIILENFFKIGKRSRGIIGFCMFIWVSLNEVEVYQLIFCYFYEEVIGIFELIVRY